MHGEILLELFIFVLAAFLGFELIAKVPSTLHTPLMSGSNAVSGIVLVAAILVIGQVDRLLLQVLAFLAIVMASVNVFGGFAVTDRMLQMFKKKPTGKSAGAEGAR